LRLICPSLKNIKIIIIIIMLKKLITSAILATTLAAKAATITDMQAANCIIGEAGNQPFKAQVAIGCVIRNRGNSTKGIYGLHNKCVAKATRQTRNRALSAWRSSAAADITNGAKYFGCPQDAVYFRKINATPVLKIGAITFYK
jgi:hypothetical protein